MITEGHLDAAATCRPARTPRSSSSAQPSSAKTYTFGVRQTYSDGSVVDWSGPESSDTPAPTIEASSSLGGRWQLDARDRRARRRRGRRAARRARALRGREAHAGVRRALVLIVAVAGALGAARDRLRARSAAAHGAAGERHGEHSAAPGRAHLQRGGRAAVRDRLGHRRQRHAGDATARRAARSTDPDTLLVPLKHVPRGLVPRLLARDLRRRPSGARRVHVRGRPEPGPGAAVRDPVDLRDGRDAATCSIARWLVFLSVMVAIGLLALRLAIARPVVRRVAGTSLRSVTVAFAVSSAVALVVDPDLPAARDRGLRAALRRSTVGALVPLVRVSAFGRGYVDLWICFALFVAAARSRSGSTGPSGSSARSPSCSPARAPSSRRQRRCSCRARRARRADRAARAVAAPRLAAPRLRLDLARRPDRPARPLARPARRLARRRAASRCRASRASRSSPS